jgi:hypothetical protein
MAKKVKKTWIDMGPNVDDLDLINEKTGEKILVPKGQARFAVTPEGRDKLDTLPKDSKETIPFQIKLKRQPLMVDRLLASKVEGFPASKKDEQRIRNYLLETKRFVIDNDGARYVAEIVRDNPKMIARNAEFAIPPFPNMYVELPFLTFYKEVTERDPDESADATVGYLFKGPHVYIITEGRDSKPIIMPWYYWMNKPWTLQEEIDASEAMGVSRMQIDAFFWGESLSKLTEDETRIFRAHHSMWMMDPDLSESVIAKKLWQNVYDTSAGDLRNITALLLLLNRSGDVKYEEHYGPHRAMIHNKPRTFLSHTVVKFKLNPVPRVMQGGRGLGAWRREHEVRGHFCHDKFARAAQNPGGSCARDKFGEPQHDWHEYGVNEWACVKCKGKRWWRKACKRGTRDKGVSKTTYEVTG